jgi:hypothetical protein
MITKLESRIRLSWRRGEGMKEFLWLSSFVERFKNARADAV